MVSVFLSAAASSRGVQLEEKSSLLCVASSMFPPWVRFSWRRQGKSGGSEEPLSADGRTLNLTESGCFASILQIKSSEISSYDYSCSVQHEGGTVEAQLQTGDESFMTSAAFGQQKQELHVPGAQWFLWLRCALSF